jgi:hypothetical protein
MRGIPLSVHSVLEMFAAPAIMVAPFALGFGPAATTLAVLIGVVLLALSLQADGAGTAVPVSAHAGFDYMLATFALAGGLAIGPVTGDWIAGVFLVGIGAAQVALAASTRFSVARSA